MNLYESIQSDLGKRGINVTVGNMYDLMAICKQWYRGSVDDFHYYDIQLANGRKKRCERATMGMAKKSCEDYAKLEWTEKTKIELDTEEGTKRLWSVLDNKKNDFTVNFPIALEKAFALGNGALVEYKSEGETLIDYIDGDLIMPYKYTNSYIYGVITISTFTEGTGNDKTYYTHLTYHEFEKGEYKKINELYKSKDDITLGQKINFKEKFPGVDEIYSVKTKNPYFQVYGPNLANNYDFSSPLRVSIFANSFDRLKSIDTKYDSFDKEFIKGKKRIVVSSKALKAKVDVDPETNETRKVKYFDDSDETYVAIDGNEMEGQPVKEIDFNLRAQEHIDAINAELNWYSSAIGLGSNFYKFDGVSVKTAKEVMSENSEAFRSREHHQLTIHSAIYDMVAAICEIEGIQYKTITITADDSIIEDKDTEQMRSMQEVTQGLKSKKKYLMDKGMSEEEAKKELEEIQKEKQASLEVFEFGSDTEKEEE